MRLDCVLSCTSASISTFSFLLLLGLLEQTRLVNSALSSCAAQSCKNGATCIDQPDTVYGFKCICSGSWTGTTCEQVKGQSGSSSIISGAGNINIPSGSGTYNNPNPNNGISNNVNTDNDRTKCRNGGTYHDSLRQCMCVSGYSGRQCETYVGKSGSGSGGSYSGGGGIFSQSRCRNGGTQTPSGSCVCPLGFHGPLCEVRLDNGNNGGIIGNPCFNGGEMTSHGFPCRCPPAFTGSRCEVVKRAPNKILGFSLGTILPFLFFLAIIGLCVYCCCFKNRNSDNGGAASFIGRARSAFGNTGPGQNQPTAAYNLQQSRPIYATQPIPDPDEVFKVNNPPPYEVVIQQKPNM